MSSHRNLKITAGLITAAAFGVGNHLGFNKYSSRKLNLHDTVSILKKEVVNADAYNYPKCDGVYHIILGPEPHPDPCVISTVTMI